MKIIPPPDIATWNARYVYVKELRGLSNEQIQEAMDVSLTAVTLWGNGSTKELTFDNGLRLSALLGVTPQWLKYGLLPMEVGEAPDTGAISKNVLTVISARTASVTPKRSTMSTISNLFDNSGPIAQGAMLSICKAIFLMEEADIQQLVELAKQAATNGMPSAPAPLNDEQRTMLALWEVADQEARDLSMVALRMEKQGASGNAVAPSKAKR